MNSFRDNLASADLENAINVSPSRSVDHHSRRGHAVSGCGRAKAKSWTTRERLIWAADDELTEQGSLTGRFDAVARRAGVSRATAYRQIGSVSELLKQVGLLRSQKHVDRLSEVMACTHGALAKIEVAMIYSARELPAEPVVLKLIAHQSESRLDPEVRRLINSVLSPVLVEGQCSGEIRRDLHFECVMHYLAEQSYLAALEPDRSEEAVRERFKTFVEPAITPRQDAKSTRTRPKGMQPNPMPRKIGGVSEAPGTGTKG